MGNLANEHNLDSSLINNEFVYKELDEKIMLGLRLEEGDIYKVLQEQNWENKNWKVTLLNCLMNGKFLKVDS